MSSRTFVVCASGNRSATTTDLIHASAYDAYSVIGGTTGWASSGRTLEFATKNG